LSPAEIVRQLHETGHALRVDGDRLIVSPKPAPQIADEIRREKSSIIAALREGLPSSWHSFSALASSDRERVRALGVCIACGVPWDMHGKPAFEAWRFVDDPNDVALVEACAVVAAAAAEATR